MTSTYTPPTVIVIGRDDIGLIAESIEPGFRMRYYLTECCHASAKGMADYVGCRACYNEIDPSLGSLPNQVGVPPVRFGDGIPWEKFHADPKGL